MHEPLSGIVMGTIVTKEILSWYTTDAYLYCEYANSFRLPFECCIVLIVLTPSTQSHRRTHLYLLVLLWFGRWHKGAGDGVDVRL